MRDFEFAVDRASKELLARKVVERGLVDRLGV